MKVAQLRFQFAVGTATMIATLGFATAYVALHDGFGSDDLMAMITWSMPLAVGVSVAMTALSARVSGASAALAYALLVPSGALLGALWTLLVALVLGGWIFAFSFPVLLCWIAGGLLGGITTAWWIHPRSWPVAGLLILLGSISLVRVNQYASEPERAIRVVIKANANAEEVDSVWMDVLGHRTGRGSEHYLLPSLSSVGGEPREGASPVLVAQFWSGTSQRTRDSVIAQISRSPLILRVDTLPVR